MRSFFLSKFFILTVFVCLLAFAFQIYMAFNFSYETFTVSLSKIEKKIESCGVIYKDEFILNFDAKGMIVKNMYPVGDKIPSNAVVARIYKNKDDAIKFENISALEEEIKDLESVQDETSSQNVDILDVNRQIQLNYVNLLNEIKDKDFFKVCEGKRNITLLFNTKNMLINKGVDYANFIEKLKLEKQNIESGINNPEDVISSESGYFADNIDGLESECCVQNVEKLNLEEFIDFIKKPISSYKPSNNYSLKVITNPIVLFKAVVPTNFLVGTKIGQSYKIKFKDIGEEIPANLYDMFIDIDKKYSLGIFSLNAMTEKLARLRKSDVEITVDRELEGFKVPKEALRVNNENEVGVYAVEGISLKFRLIDILSENTHFIICAAQPKDMSKIRRYLKNFDKIIVKGRNLYENKPI